MQARLTTAAATLLIAAGGCDGDPDPERICDPGTTMACVGPGGCAGGQVCASDGLSYGACDCGAELDAGLDRDAETELDAGEVTVDGGDDAGPADSGALVGDGGTCTVPTSGFGTSEGRYFSPLTLDRCDGTPYSFYDPGTGYCDASFTVIIIAAGWCGPCRREAQEMETALTQVYRPRGVRVITTLIQDNNYLAPDAAFCDGWVTTYGLTNDVLLDPTQETGIYFPMGALPANLIVDSTGRIVHREYGFSEALGTIRAELDRLLAP